MTQVIILLVSLLVTIIALSLASYTLAIPSYRFPKGAPHFIGVETPFVGSLGFFTHRWDWFKERAGKHGSFSFWAGRYPVVALSGLAARKTFFGSRDLDPGEGFRALYGGALASNDPDVIEGDYFMRRLSTLLKGERLQRILPTLLEDIVGSFERLATDPGKTVDPWETLFKLVFQLNLRTVACKEIASDPEEARSVLNAFETIERTGDSLISLTAPWFPTLSVLRRVIAAIRLSRILKRVVAKREESGRREDDALQLLIDQKDSIRQMTEFTLASLWAGQINTGINAAWMIFYLSRSSTWRNKVRDEVELVARRYTPDSSLLLRDRLMKIPLHAWETEFPTVDVCLKEIIRLTLVGTAFRRNWHSNGTPVRVSTEGQGEIPFGAYAVYPINEVHYDPEIYPNPHVWDPARYSPERAEDQKVDLAWLGWGALRHPCMGMRFAKLEINLLTAFWVTYFDSETVDASGAPTEEIPEIDVNAHAPQKPKLRVYVKMQPR